MNQEAETQKAKGVEPKAETTMGQPVNAEENTNSGGPPPWVHLYNIALCVAAFVIGGISVSRDYEPTQVGATLLGFGGVVLVRYLIFLIYRSGGGGGSDDERANAVPANGDTNRADPTYQAKQKIGLAVLTTAGVILGLITFGTTDMTLGMKLAAGGLGLTVLLALFHLDIVSGLLLSPGSQGVGLDIELFLIQTIYLSFAFGLVALIAGSV